MTRPEWARITARIMRLWPHQTIPDDALAEWYTLLADLDGTLVNTAVTALATGGREFPPPAGVIRAKAAELCRPGVTFEQVWSQINRVVGTVGRYQEANALEALEPVPFALDLVAVMGGWQAVCNAGPDEAKPVDPGVWRASAEHAFKALVLQRRDDEATAGLPGPHGDTAKRRLAGDMTPLARIDLSHLGLGEPPPVPELPSTGARPPLALPPPPAQRAKPHLPGMGPRADDMPTPPTPNGNGLKPEYRAEIERMIREGQEAKVPERWRRYVPEIKAAMEAKPE